MKPFWGKGNFIFHLSLMHWDRQSFLHSVTNHYSDSQNSHESQKVQRKRGEAQQLSREVQREEQFMNKLISYIR